MLDNKIILLGLTTTPGSNWLDKVEEIKTFGLKEVALLPTTLTFEQRRNLYKMLEQTPLESAPLVHLRHDMEQAELDYLVEKYKVKAFCLHADEQGFALFKKLPKYQSMIFMENSGSDKIGKYFNKKVFEEYQTAGICLDLAHLESRRLDNKKFFEKIQSIISKYPIFCNQVSAVNSNIFLKLFHKSVESRDLKSLDELDYLRKYPSHYFGKYLIIELNNSFQEQMEVRKHLANILEYVIE